MPPRRPPSPLSLETCAPEPSGLDTDGILGSDDELDEAGRASQRQRVERLADSYRNGRSLFIASASLRGPLGEGWVNPWRKNRRRVASGDPSTQRGRKQVDSQDHLVVQETDPRRRQLDALPRPEYSKSSVAIPESSQISPACVEGRSTRVDNRKLASEGERSGASKSPSGPKRTLPWKHSRAQSGQTDDDWLKKDHTRLRSSHIQPPDSPTSALSTRRQTKQLSTTPSSRRTFHSKVQESATVNRKEAAHFQSNNPLHSSPHTAIENPPSGGMHSSPSQRQPTSHSKRRGASAQAVDPETSLCIVSSSSNLPQFEYRRAKKPASDRKRSRASSIPKAETTVTDTSNVSETIRPDPAVDTIPKEGLPDTSANPDAHEHHDQGLVTEDPHHEDIHTAQPEKETDHTTESTNEHIPSAQKIPQHPSTTDPETSLHSTAIPTNNTEPEEETRGLAPQLSTQAALFLAQQTFQNDLKTPEQEHTRPSKKRRRTLRASEHSQSHRKSITPFNRLSAPRVEARRSNGPGDGQMMSTQYMIDAVTPFSVSTGTKSNGHTEEPATRSHSSKKQKRASFAASSLDDGSPSPSPSNQDFSPLAPINKPDQNQSTINNDNTSPSESQMTATPLNLTGSGSPAPTGPDGQGAEIGAAAGTDSFNLNQAIAEMGSWLRESFDLNRDLRQSAPAPAPAP